MEPGEHLRAISVMKGLLEASINKHSFERSHMNYIT